MYNSNIYIYMNYKSNTRKKKYRKNKTLKKVNCSANKKYNTDTCYSNRSIDKLKKYWNVRHPDERINSNDPKIIWNELKDNLLNVCDKESCWLRQKFIANNLDKELKTYTFAPKSPNTWKKNINEWLSSVDIENVMKQYENNYKNFSFIGPSPIDFDYHKLYGDCVWEELCKFNLQDYIVRNKNKIGIIFNTDPHYKQGSHWISLFINLKEKYIFYFDSNGDKAPKEIYNLCEKIQKQAKKLNIDLEFIENYPIEHQKTSSECGMYALYFVITLLTNKENYKYFLKKRIEDSKVERFRKIYFNEDL